MFISNKKRCFTQETQGALGVFGQNWALFKHDSEREVIFELLILGLLSPPREASAIPAEKFHTDDVDLPRIFRMVTLLHFLYN